MSKPLEPVQEDGSYVNANIDSAPPGSGLAATPTNVNKFKVTPGPSRSGTSPFPRSIIDGSVADTDDGDTQMRSGRNQSL